MRCICSATAKESTKFFPNMFPIFLREPSDTAGKLNFTFLVFYEEVRRGSFVRPPSAPRENSGSGLLCAQLDRGSR
jgi:hypothetical protein